MFVKAKRINRRAALEKFKAKEIINHLKISDGDVIVDYGSG
jgi:hypothetical protein